MTDSLTGAMDDRNDSDLASDQRFTLPDVYLPQGGGAIRGLDERFAVNGINGTATFTLPVPVSPARGGQPVLSLSYNSGGGNGPFGLGWSADVPSVSRRTDRGLPRYRDAEESDTYTMTGVEDLVVARDPLGVAVEDTRNDESGQPHHVCRYRPRIEGAFSRIERWQNLTNGVIHWRATTGGNVTSVFGQSAEARLADPEDHRHVFRWMCERRYDDRGTLTLYEYKAEDLAGIPDTPADASRLNGLAPATALYLKRILYGNRDPYVPGDPLPTEDRFRFQTVFDYGEHDDTSFTDLGGGRFGYAADPQPGESGQWAARPDSFSNFRSGFDIRTWRRCRRILLFHAFDTPVLTRSLDLAYDDSDGCSLLVSATRRGYIREGTGYTTRALPTVTFGYTRHAWDATVHDIATHDMAGLQAGLSSDGQLFTDLYGEGLPGLLSRHGGNWHYARNRGGGRFAPLESVDPRPSFATATSSLSDIGGDGRQRLASHAAPQGQFTLEQNESWTSFRPFTTAPNADPSDPNVRSVDLTGDGRPDLLITETDRLVWYASIGEKGHAPPEITSLLDDELRNPRVAFAEALQSVFLADMTGDGLTDIVRIRNGAVSYWPNRGYGCFGARIDMANPPLFDAPDRFDATRLQLADIDGSGSADLLYLGDKVRMWRNLSGNEWLAAPTDVTGLPPKDSGGTVTVADVHGQGTACLVWSSALPAHATRPVRIVDLMAGIKPRLMTTYANGSGAEVTVDYASSTQFYLADRAAGHPWATKLPFPVHVVTRTRVRDLVAETERTEIFSYHHGHYDTSEREFRGFARVDRRDSDQAAHFVRDGTTTLADPFDQPPVLTRTWYHTGAGPDVQHLPAQLAKEYFSDPTHPEPALPPTALPSGTDPETRREAARALKGKMLREEVFAEDGSPRARIPITIATSRHHVRAVQGRFGDSPTVFLPTVLETLTLHVEQGNTAPRIAHSLTLETDHIGNPLRTANVVYPRAVPDPALPPEAQVEQARRFVTLQSTTYSNDIETATDYRLRLSVEELSFELTGLPEPGEGIYRLEELDAAIAAAADIPFEAPPSGVAERRQTSGFRTEFWDNDGVTPLPLGQISARALARRSLALAFTNGLINQVYGADIDAPAMVAAGYEVQGSAWWRPTSTVSYGPFFLPVSVTTVFGATGSITYDPDGLMIESRADFAGNITQFVNDPRTLSPREKRSPNLNRTEVATDELGFVTATARLGDGTDGDTMADPTVRHSYDLGVFAATGRPNFVRTERKERHGPGAPTQVTVEYTNGAGGVQMVKRQAEPGLARVRTPAGITEIDTTPALRWVASGRIVQNNKGNPVKTYEPYFSINDGYEAEADLVQVGVSALRQYDPLGREIRIDHPDGTFERTDFTPWIVLRHDRNDTVLDSDWYQARGAPDPLLLPEPADPQTRAAWLAAQHADTPTREHFDTLGRSIVTETDAGAGSLHRTRTLYDIQNRQREVIDPRGNSAMRYRYEITGERIAEDGPDSGVRRLFPDAMGRVILAWDSRGHRTRTEYDALDRPVRGWLSVGGAAEVLVTRTDFGDGPDAPADAVARNLRTRMFRRFDQAGMIVNDSFDLNGNLERLSRRLVTATTGVTDYNRPDPMTPLEAETFVSETTYDALSRPVTVKSPASAGMVASTITPIYNAAQALDQLDLAVRGGSAQPQVTNIDHDAHGRRTAIDYANGTRTENTFDPLTFRLTRVLTLRGAEPMQDLHYTYDPVGNVTEISDAAQAATYFNGAVVGAQQHFRYDALYRLLFASGREHIGQNLPPNAEDPTRRGHLHPDDGAAMRRYEEEYSFDLAGNLLDIVHRAGNGAFAEQWRQTLTYAPGSNRLIDSTSGGTTVTYGHDAHGNMQLPHTDTAEWDQNDRLRRVTRGTAEARYTYDADGMRIRKTEIRGATVEERLYLGGFELFRRRAGTSVSLERETVHLLDGESRVALVETPTVDTATPANVGVTLARFQYQTHIGSAALELNGAGAVISYEEYYPFGATSYQAGRDQTETRRKTYRYVAAEQDDITGLYHMSARYYAPWIGRWTQTDPKGLVDGPNLYRYARNNPVRLTDRAGTDPDDEVEVGPLRLTNIRIDATGGPGITPTGVPMFLPPRPGPRLQFSSRLSLAPMPPSLPLDQPAPEELPQQRDEADDGDTAGDSGTPVRAEATAQISADPDTGDITASTEAFGTIGTIGSGIWASVHASGTFTAPPPDSSSIDPYLFARHAEGSGSFFGALQVPGLTLGTLSGDLTLRSGGQFDFGAQVDSIGGLAQLNIDGEGQLREGGVDLEATGQLRLFGYSQLRLDVAGSVESSGEFAFSGGARGLIFPTPLPIPTTYVLGTFSYTSAAGFSGTGHLFGLGPLISLPDIPDPSPLNPVEAAYFNPPEDTSIQPLIFGYGLFHYSRGRFSGITAGAAVIDGAGDHHTPLGSFGVGASGVLAF